MADAAQRLLQPQIDTDSPARTESPTLLITYLAIFLVGIACMAVSGYFLIEGLSEFSGGAGAKRMLIVGGILFQVTESICFMSAAALTAHSRSWRYLLFTLGSVLFLFSIAVMTLAQKTALQAGEAQAQAIDEKRDQLRLQLQSLDKVIASYRLNAEKQSRSIYKDSRALGQDSLNRATELEERKMALSNTLFALNEKRRQTSVDFFNRIEQVLGVPSAQAEFYFLVIRSLLLELCGIVLLSFSANLRAYNRLIQKQEKLQTTQAVDEPVVDADLVLTRQESKREVNPQKSEPHQQHLRVVENATVMPPDDDGSTEHEPETAVEEELPSHWASPKIRGKQLKHTAGITETELQLLATMVWDLYEQKIIRGLSRDTIRRALREHCNKRVSHEVATMLAKIIKSRQESYG